ncbi:unnamed protein product [Adineta ricciae]|uniref:Uncharacterized protein n=1 Tax=Adineta ricciae TaxID=249248 RepID=A0A816HES1_ADIRI|nr:unnamed protein product [Adineta ricciae]
MFSFYLVKHSKCRSDFLNRVKQSEQLKRAAKESGKPVPASSLKRQPQGPRKQHLVRTRGNKPQIVEPIPYQFVA